MPLSKVEKTLNNIDTFFKKHSMTYAVIGGIAGIIYSLSRTTRDIDITINVEIENLKDLAKYIANKFIPIKKNPVDFFEKYYVLPAYDKQTNIHIDFAAGLSEFDKNVIKRSKKIKFGYITISVCSIEDLIIYKLVASRTQDLADIEELLRIHKNKIDFIYLKAMTREFIKVDRSDVEFKLNEMIKNIK